MLFFQSVAALLNPVHRRGERIKRGLVSHTTLIFSVVTILTATTLNNRSLISIDNRKYTSVGGVAPTGPVGYQLFIDSSPLSLTADVMFFLNAWLADGLLVSLPFDVMIHPPRSLTPVLPPALPLSYNLRFEHLGDPLPFPYVRRLCGYVFEFPIKHAETLSPCAIR